MQSVTEFVEQSLDLLVRHQRGLVSRRRRKVAKQGDSWPLVFSIRQQFAADDFELCEVIEFSFARKHIEIKHPERFARGGIGHHVKLEIFDPFVRCGDLLEFQTKDALINIEHAVEHFLEREKYAQRFLINGVLLFVPLVGIIAPVPHLDFGVGVIRFSGLQLL